MPSACVTAARRVRALPPSHNEKLTPKATVAAAQTVVPAGRRPVVPVSASRRLVLVIPA